MVAGREISTYNERGEQYEVHARALASWRTDAESLSQMAVPSTRLGAVSLDNVARFEESHKLRRASGEASSLATLAGSDG